MSMILEGVTYIDIICIEVFYDCAEIKKGIDNTTVYLHTYRTVVMHMIVCSTSSKFCM